MKPGAYQINETDYHRDPEYAAVSSSHFKSMAKSMAHYVHYRNNPPQKDVFDIGRLFHFAVLEPHKFTANVAVYRDGIRKGKKWDAFNEANADKIIIKPADYDQINYMAGSVQNHPLAMAIINHKQSVIEESIFWNDATTGEKCKCRPDIRIESEGLIADLKGVVNAEKNAFRKACADYYQFQPPFYLDGASAAIAAHDTFIFIAVEKEPPYPVAIYQADYEFLEIGRNRYRELLMKYAQCKIENRWPGYSDGIQEISLPRWATYVNEGA